MNNLVDTIELLKRWMQIHEAHAAGNMQLCQSLMQKHCQESGHENPVERYNSLLNFLAGVTVEESKEITARAMQTINNLSKRKQR